MGASVEGKQFDESTVASALVANAAAKDRQAQEEANEREIFIREEILESLNRDLRNAVNNLEQLIDPDHKIFNRDGSLQSEGYTQGRLNKIKAYEERVANAEKHIAAVTDGSYRSEENLNDWSNLLIYHVEANWKDKQRKTAAACIKMFDTLNQ